MHGEDRIDQVAAKCAEPSKDSILIRTCKPRVADDVSYQDRREFPGLAHGAIAEADRSRRSGLGMAALPCCTEVSVEAGSAGPACRLAKPIHAAFEHITIDEGGIDAG